MDDNSETYEHASVLPKGYLELVFKCVPTDDVELTCFFCSKNHCDYEFYYRYDDRSGGRRSIAQGIHRSCMENPKYIK